MKNRGLLFMLCCLLAGAACTQPRTLSKGYAFSRPTMGGAAPVGGIDEKGAAQPAAKGSSADVMIWVQRKEGTDLVVENVWVNGQHYNASVEPVANTPVVLQDGVGKPVTLVPATGSKVWQLLLKGLKSPQVPPPPAAKTGSVVIEYQAGEKRKYFTIPVIKPLAPLSLQ